MKALIFILCDEALACAPASECHLPMAPVGGVPLIEHTVTLLRKHGVTDVAISVDRHPWAIIKHLGHGRRWGVRIHYAVKEHPLRSAAATKQLEWFLDERFVVLDGNVYTDVDLSTMFDAHRASGAPVTLALHPVDGSVDSDVVQLDGQGQVVRFLKNIPTPPPSRLARAGAFVVEPDVLASLSPDQSQEWIPDVLAQLLATHQTVAGFATASRWIDLRSPQGWQQAEQLIAQPESGQALSTLAGSIIAPTAHNMLYYLSNILFD